MVSTNPTNNFSFIKFEFNCIIAVYQVKITRWGLLGVFLKSDFHLLTHCHQIQGAFNKHKLQSLFSSLLSFYFSLIHILILRKNVHLH